MEGEVFSLNGSFSFFAPDHLDNVFQIVGPLCSALMRPGQFFCVFRQNPTTDSAAKWTTCNLACLTLNIRVW
jgi:hypothetical protein